MVNDELQYRFAVPADYEELQHIINAAYEVEKFFKTTDRIDQQEIIERADNGKFVIGQTPNGIAACIYLKTNGTQAYFGLLSVKPAEQSKGYARAMITKAEDLAKKENCNEMEIEVVNLRTELFPFYTKLGYKQTTTRPFVDVSKSKLACHFVVMTKQLN